MILLGGPVDGGVGGGGALSIHISCRIGEDRSAAGEQKIYIMESVCQYNLS